ncbi:MAG: hypothetical protein AB7N80_12285 [Bdellovibrionales bacterium]
MKRLLLLTLIFYSSISLAANRYVRQGAVGANNGSDWTNAYPSLPATLIRGDTYYIGDGSYGRYTFDDPLSGIQVITLKKATVADHGTAVGWQDSYGDGQATFSDMTFNFGYYTIDGQKRNESNWQDTPSYGFRNTGSVYSSALNPGPTCADNLVIRYVDIGGPPGSAYSESLPSSGFYFGGFGESCDRWVVHRSHIHHVEIPFQIAGGSTGLIEYNWIGPGWAKEAIRGQIKASNFIIRNNVFKDSCQFTPGDQTSGCTAEIAMWDGSAAGSFSGNEIYGNIFQKTTNEHNSGGVIVVGGNGSSWVGVSASNTKIYNNTLVGFHQGNAMILVNGGTGNAVTNNIWYDIGPGVFFECSANTCTNNLKLMANPFVAYPNNLRLSIARPGTTLGAPYDVDLTGVMRGSDGVWDVGAYEFGGTIPVPTGRKLKSSTTTIRVTP